jgi:tRNA(Ile)-lysidine synthase
MIINQFFFEQYLKKNYIFEKFPKIVVGVSGGPDSMCLLFLLNKWIKKNNGSLMAIIIDHQLRKESNLEANYIKDYIFTIGISSSIIKIHKKNIKKKTMEEARNNRFNCLFKYCKENKILHLFLGHHFDDNLETYLIRKIAGSNFEGLSGIKKKIISDNVQVLRPLINFNKKSILTYNKLNNIKYVLDPSNKNLNYTRSVVRKFLEDDCIYKKNIKKDFKMIKKNYVYFKKIIFQSFHEILVKINNKSVFIDRKIFYLKDEIIQSKIIEIIYKYLKPTRQPLRYKKIRILLDVLEKNNTSDLNLAGLAIKKDNLLIKFLT